MLNMVKNKIELRAMYGHDSYGGHSEHMNYLAHRHNTRMPFWMH